MRDGIENPIAFESNMLNPAKRNLYREASIIILGVTKFHKYLAGNQFIIITDH